MFVEDYLVECQNEVENTLNELISILGEDTVKAYASYRWGFARKGATNPAMDAVALTACVPADKLVAAIAEMGPDIDRFVEDYGEGFTADIMAKTLGLVPGNPNMGLKKQSFDGSDKNEGESPDIPYHLENLLTDAGLKLREEILDNASDEAKAYFDDLDYDPVRVIDATKLSENMWHGLRQFSIGASEVAAVTGSSPFQNALSLWHLKMNHQVEVEDSEAEKQHRQLIFDWGHQSEAYIRKLLLTHPDFDGCKVIVEPMMFSNEFTPFMTCNLDAILQWPDGHFSILEFKAPNARAREHYSDGAVPLYYMEQMQAQMMHLNIDDAYLVALFDRDTFTVSRVVRDVDYQMGLAMQVGEFWNKHLMSGMEPPLNGNGSITIETVRKYGGKGNAKLPEMQLDERTFAQILAVADHINQERKSLKEQVKRLDTEFENAIAPIVAQMGQTTKAVCVDSASGYTYSCKYAERASTPQMKKADIEAMQRNEPQLYLAVQPYISYRAGSRPFSLTATRR